MKNIVICGAGEVGFHLADVLSRKAFNVTVIDMATKALKKIEDSMDVRTVRGSACHSFVLQQSDIAKADLLVAATDKDEINLLTATLGKKMGARKVIARIHHRAFLTYDILDYESELQIDHLVCPERQTAFEIAQYMGNPGVMAFERFALDALEMRQYAVTESSRARDQTLTEMAFPRGVRIATVKRDNKAFIPEATTKLQVGDTVKIVGDRDHFAKINDFFHKPEKLSNQIAIMGGASLTRFLVADLRRFNFSIRIFEPDAVNARDLSQSFAHATILQADPTDAEVFREEQLERCSGFVAASENDEHNILAALHAKNMGTKHTVVITQKNTYAEMLSDLGINRVYSPRIVAAREILRFVDDEPVRHLATLAPDVAEVYELTTGKDGLSVGQRVRDLKLPKSTFIAAIQQGRQVQVPVAEDVIQPNTNLILIGPVEIEKELRSIFIG